MRVPSHKVVHHNLGQGYTDHVHDDQQEHQRPEQRLQGSCNGKNQGAEARDQAYEPLHTEATHEASEADYAHCAHVAGVREAVVLHGGDHRVHQYFKKREYYNDHVKNGPCLVRACEELDATNCKHPEPQLYHEENREAMLYDAQAQWLLLTKVHCRELGLHPEEDGVEHHSSNPEELKRVRSDQLLDPRRGRALFRDVPPLGFLLLSPLGVGSLDLAAA
mmetsp:Transcript_49002/g.136179  ORF Transcript_49002/g.136179 Transcript_49002/m.136179 type:complete len:220 (-) Transcript_49002:664-1323(-)